MLNIPVVLGSVRKERKSLFPAKYMAEKISALGHQTQVVDFLELPLPFFDSPMVPVGLKGVYPHENVQKWSEIAKNADGFVLIVSEYNHGYTGVLKNALDWLYNEFTKKPFGLCGVSDGKFGGLRSMEQIRPVIENFGSVALRETVPFGPVQDVFGSEGKLLDLSYEKKADGLLKNLVWWAEALRNARKNV